MRNARFTAYQRGEKPGGEEEQIASYRLFRQLFASFRLKTKTAHCMVMALRRFLSVTPARYRFQCFLGGNLAGSPLRAGFASATATVYNPQCIEIATEIAIEMCRGCRRVVLRM
jgi:hypothetical protein